MPVSEELLKYLRDKGVLPNTQPAPGNAPAPAPPSGTPSIDAALPGGVQQAAAQVPGMVSRAGQAVYNAGKAALPSVGQAALGTVIPGGQALAPVLAAGMKPDETPPAVAPPTTDTRATTPDQAAGARSTMLLGGGSPVKTGFQSTVSPETRGMLNAANATQHGAIGEMGEAQQGEANAGADASRYQAIQMAVENADAVQKDRKRQYALQDQQREADRMRKDFDDGKVGEYDRRGTGAKMLGALAVAMGEFGKSMTHGSTNTALSIITKQIDDDYQERKDALAKKGDKAKHADDMVSRLRDRFGDERAVETAHRALRFQEYGLRAQEMAQRAKSPALKAQADMLSAALDQKAAEQNAATEHQVTTGGGGIDWRKQYMAEQVKYDEEARKAAAEGKPGSLAPFPSLDQYLATHAGAGGGAPGVGPGGAPPGGASPPVPGSTAYNPARLFPGTDADKSVMDQQAWNTAVVENLGAKLKKGGSRAGSPEAIQSIAKQYMVQPGDTKAVVAYKAQLAKRDLGMGPPTGGAPPASASMTPVGAR